MDDELVPSLNLKYLTSGKLEKETIKDYINTTRHMLRKNLTNEARKRDLSSVSDKYETEVKNLKEAQESFEEDYQRFITMKADMESMAQVGSEQLTAKMKNIADLEREIFHLQSQDESLQVRIKEQAENIQHHVNSKRIVSWLEREMELGLYDDFRRAEYLNKLEQEASDDNFGDAADGVRASSINLGVSHDTSVKYSKNQVGQVSFINQAGANQEAI